jgi:hypothetical protein
MYGQLCVGEDFESVVHQLRANRQREPEQFIGTVDLWSLHQLRWPVMRVFARHFVETQELCRYERDLLSTGRWASVRFSPHASERGDLSSHVFDVYGAPRNAAEKLPSGS